MSKSNSQREAADSTNPRNLSRPAKSGIQSLRDGVFRALHLGGSEDSRKPAASEWSRSELVERFGQLSWTADKQARVIEVLEKMVEQVHVARQRERRLSALEQKALFNEQDRFLSQLIEENEIALRAACEDRDAALRRVEELQAELDAAYSYCRQLERAGRPATASDKAANAEAAALRSELAFARQRIDKLTSRCNVSRNTLQRVMSQRDEALAAVSRLLQELRDGTDAPGHARSEATVEAETADEDSPPTLPASDLDAAPNPVAREANVVRQVPPTLRARPSSPPSPSSGPGSPLALALANSDPERKKSSVRPPPRPDTTGRAD